MAFSAPAADLSKSDQKRHETNFEKKQSQTRTFKAALLQTLRLSGVRNPVRSKGVLFYQAPDSLLIKFTEPAGEYVLIRGEDLYLKKSGKPAEHHKLDSDEPQNGLPMILELFRNGAIKMKEQYRVEMKALKKRLEVRLTPKPFDVDSPLPEIINHIRLPDLEIRSIEVKFDEDQSMIYEFLDTRRNKPIDPETFFVRKGP